MAKITPDESGETVVKGKGPAKPELRAPSKPPRGFPFRLWFWAIMMTVAAGAGGYFTYQFRNQALDAKTDLATCEKEKNQGLSAQQIKDQAAAEEAAAKAAADLGSANQDRDAKAKDLTACQAAVNQMADLKKAADDRMSKMEDFYRSFEEMRKTGDLKVVSRRGSLVFELPSEVLFPSASADLSKAGYVTLIQFAGILRDKFSDRRFIVVGHTDHLPLKSTKYKDNLELSTARGLTVTRTLAEGGVKPENLLASGAGDSDPVADNSTPAGRAQNRRIEIVLLPALADLPPLPTDIADPGK